MENYLFKSDRLGFRNWQEQDLDFLAAMNADPEVMHYFPKAKTKEESLTFIRESREKWNTYGYCFFAVEALVTQEVMGFIGLNYIDYEATFTPNVEIGWRLAKKFHGKGFATEGAKACLQYGFEKVGLKEIYSICPTINQPSEKVMIKIGMEKLGTFKHPALTNYPRIEKCYLYKINPT